MTASISSTSPIVAAPLLSLLASEIAVLEAEINRRVAAAAKTLDLEAAVTAAEVEFSEAVEDRLTAPVAQVAAAEAQVLVAERKLRNAETELGWYRCCNTPRSVGTVPADKVGAALTAARADHKVAVARRDEKEAALAAAEKLAARNQAAGKIAAAKSALVEAERKLVLTGGKGYSGFSAKKEVTRLTAELASLQEATAQ